MSLYQRLVAYGRAMQTAETARIASTVAAARISKTPIEPMKSFSQHWRDLCSDYQCAIQRAEDLWNPGREGFGWRDWGYDEAAAKAARNKWSVSSL